MSATKRLRRNRLLNATRVRREWLKREIAKTDAQLKLLEDHIRAQLARIDELDRDGAETAAARDFLVTLQDCYDAHQTYHLRLASDLQSINE